MFRYSLKLIFVLVAFSIFKLRFVKRGKVTETTLAQEICGDVFSSNLRSQASRRRGAFPDRRAVCKVIFHEENNAALCLLTGILLGYGQPS